MRREARVFKIDGAVVMPEMKIVKPDPIDPTFRIPDMNYSYKWGMWLNNFLWASKDAGKWVLAITVEVDGEYYGISEIEQFLQ